MHMERINACLENRFPGVGRAALLREHLTRACTIFIESGLADAKFVDELTFGSDAKFWSSLSEALVYQRLTDKKFPPRARIGVGPDFLVDIDDRRLWIELICPEPMGIAPGWTNVEPGTATSMPHEEMLLRWTAAIKEKNEKLVGTQDGRTRGYIQTGVVNHDDIYVIAINASQLRHGPFPSLTGITQLPFAVEAVFPVGPYQLKIDPTTMRVVERGHAHRMTITKPNGAQIPTHAFLNPWFRNVSAIWALDLNGQAIIGNAEPSALVHNPNAFNPLPKRFLPADAEFVAELTDEEHFSLRDIRLNPTS